MTAKPPTHDELTAAMKVMVANTTLDAAIEAACKEVNIGRADGFQEFDRTYARALIAKLIEGLDDYRDPLAEIRRRASIEGGES